MPSLCRPLHRSAIPALLALATLGGAGGCGGASGTGTADTLLARVEELCARGRLSPAQSLLEEALNTYPGDARLHRELGYVYLRRGLIPGREFHYAAARSRLEEASRLAPEDGRTHLLLGEAHQRLGNADEARRAFEVALVHAAEDAALAEGLVRLAMVRYTEGELEGARAALERALTIEPDSFQALTWLSRVARADDRDQVAYDYVRRALEIEPDYSDASYHLGTMLAEDGEPREAEAAFVWASEVSADLYQALFEAARLMEADERLDEALNMYRRTLGVNPGHIRAGTAAGRLLLLAVERGSVPNRGRALDEAERVLRNVLKRNAGQAEARALVERLERLRNE